MTALLGLLVLLVPTTCILLANVVNNSHLGHQLIQIVFDAVQRRYRVAHAIQTWQSLQSGQAGLVERA